jgi:23S rRNA (adenine-N6)-dimethyltransferase
VVEIGGGTGAITVELARTGAAIRVLERDPALARVLRTRFDSNPAVEVVLADALEYVWPEEPFSVVANLPFAGSGAILASLLRDPGLPLRRALVIVQWEFAAKHAAVWPATQRATYWRAWYDVSIARRLDRTAFAPPPSVDTAVLRLERRARARVPQHLHEADWRFLSDAFSSQQPVRRGVRTLSALQVKRLAPALGFGPATRSRDLDAEQWACLFAVTRGGREAAK